MRMQRHTLEITVEAELVDFYSDNSGMYELYRKPDGAHVVQTRGWDGSARIDDDLDERQVKTNWKFPTR
jgi:hypothetical protein